MKGESYNKKKLSLALFLSGLSGFIDILGLTSAGGMFLSFMSGNTTRMALNLAHGSFRQALPYILIILSFVLGAFIGDLIKSFWRKQKIVLVLLVEAGLIFTSFAMLSLDLSDEFSYIPLTIAMGVQNTIKMEIDGKIIGRTFYSGLLHSFGVSLSQVLQKKKNWKSAGVDLAAWFVALSGALSAAFLQISLSVTVLLLSVGIILLSLVILIIIISREGEFLSLV